jgi:uncharacterized protein YndB with AHSA1/START domain
MPPQPLVIQGHVTIAATPQDVFDALADPTTWFRIDPTLVDVTPRERLVLGMTGTMRNRRGPGLTATATWTTTELISGARLVQQLHGFGYELTEAVTLELDVLGTRMSVVDSLTPTSLAGRVMVSLSRGIMERDLHARFARLKALLETSQVPEG